MFKEYERLRYFVKCFLYASVNITEKSKSYDQRK